MQAPPEARPARAGPPAGTATATTAAGNGCSPQPFTSGDAYGSARRYSAPSGPPNTIWFPSIRRKRTPRTTSTNWPAR